jgi:hypothetical protein
VNVDAALEFKQLVQRGFDHHEHGRLHDALSDWETASRLDPKSSLAKRLVQIAQKRAAEIEAGEHDVPSRRSTIESPIPQFLAALTERKSEKVPEAPAPTPTTWIDDLDTPDNEFGIVAEPQSVEAPTMQDPVPEESRVPDTLEDLPVNAEDVRASANELIGECRAALNDNRSGPASLAAELVLQLGERAPPPGVDDLIEPSRALFERAFRAFMGNPHGCPIRAVPTETIADHGLDQRAAFMMSRMDGLTSIADLIDSSGMPRFDAVRVLSAMRRAKAIDILPPLL